MKTHEEIWPEGRCYTTSTYFLATPMHPFRRTRYLADTIINETFEHYREKLKTVILDLIELAGDIKDNDLLKLASDILATINSPFLFVVVGEIKAGKSSFVNALIGKPVCKVDPAPCTHEIQQIVYASEYFESNLSAEVKQIGLPIDILQKVAIVDTPGTNTVIQHHQEITRRFIPSSGLVVFVFPAKNPYTLTAWQLLDFVSDEWKKKVIFVLQQADLATDAELKTNMEQVRKYAKDHHIDSPELFAVSAKHEIDGKKDSGFGEVRQFIRDTVTGGGHLRLKLESAADTCTQIVTKFEETIACQRNLLENDIATAEKIQAKVLRGRDTIESVFGKMLERILAEYDIIAENILMEFDEGLSPPALFKRTIGSALTKKQSITKWASDLKDTFATKLRDSFHRIIDEDSRLLSEKMKDFLSLIMDELQKIENPSGALPSESVYAGGDREKIISDIRRKALSFLETEIFPHSAVSGPSSAASTLMGGSALTIVGTIMLTTTHIPFIDITGGILTGIGLLMAGGFVFHRKKRMLRKLKKNISEGKNRLEADMSSELAGNLGALFEEISGSFTPLYRFIDSQHSAIQAFEDRKNRVREKTDLISNEIKAMT